MTAHPLRDRAAIVGVGYTEFSKNSGVSTLALALRAIGAALEDSGLNVRDVDGVATHRVFDSVQAAVVAQALGIQDCRFFLDQFGGGSASHTIVGQAAMAVACGVADYVVCWRAINARSEFRMGGTGRPPPDVVEFQYQTPYGYATPPQQFAALARAYMDRYSVPREAFGRVAITQRANAARSPRAMMQTPIDHGRLPGVAMDRRAALSLRLLPGDRRRHRGGRDLGRAGARPLRPCP